MRFHTTLLSAAVIGLIGTIGFQAATVQDSPQPLPEVRALLLQGRSLEQAKLDEAVKTYEMALALARERKHAPSEAYALLRLGYALTSNHSLRAIDLLERSFALFGELGDRTRQGECLISLSSAAKQTSQQEKALGYSTALENLARELNNNVLLTYALNGIAGVFRERGQATRAIE